ncbi:MAG: response regulator [Bdellovibrionales bacterium]|jgi:CheY-like chemotaxis protein|nr:response regulator [Bdellovibrionales bacterium]
MEKDQTVDQSADEFVVVAEDSTPNRTVLVLLLRKLGFKVLECDDGDVAWSAMDSHRDKNIVAVISDIMMPKMDGLELLRRVRSDRTYGALPFVFVTAISEKDYVFEARNLQANGYILKPVTYRRVAQKLQEIFPVKKLPEITDPKIAS